ncbi:hypothetical protein D3C71_1931260 [compost metagenome]
MRPSGLSASAGVAAPARTPSVAAMAVARILAKGEVKASVNRICFVSSGVVVCDVFKAHGSHPDGGMTSPARPMQFACRKSFSLNETGLNEI